MRTSQIISQNILSCESGLHINAQPMSLGFGFWLNSLFAYMGGNLLTVQSFIHTHSNYDIFHDSDKMPKHVEMVRTKCQPKIGTDKMPTTIKNLDKMPIFGWHFVRTSMVPMFNVPFMLYSRTVSPIS